MLKKGQKVFIEAGDHLIHDHTSRVSSHIQRDTRWDTCCDCRWYHRPGKKVHGVFLGYRKIEGKRYAVLHAITTTYAVPANECYLVKQLRRR